MRFNLAFPRTQVSLVLSAAVVVLTASATQAHADTYKLTTIAYTQSESFFGIDAAGDFSVNVFDQISHPGAVCGSTASPLTCFETFYVGQSTPVFTVAPPNLSWDNGSLCTPSVNGVAVVRGLCNGSHFLASGVFTSPDGSGLRGIWAGPNPDPHADYLSHGSIDGGFMNSNGDAVYIDGLNNTLVFADDLTIAAIAPEPSSVLLFGTGAVGLFAAARRRLLS